MRLRAHLEPLIDRRRRGLAVSMEMVEIDPIGSLKMNNLHERLLAGGPAEGAP